jgi:hypothetical protein
MAYTYRWQIARVNGYQEHPELTELKDAIGEIHWEVEIRDMEDMSIHYIRAVTTLGQPDPNNYIDYLELDHTDILSMVWNMEGGREALEQRARQELDDLRAPKTRELQTMDQHWLQTCCPDGENVDLKGSVTTSSN